MTFFLEELRHILEASQCTDLERVCYLQHSLAGPARETIDRLLLVHGRSAPFAFLADQLAREYAPLEDAAALLKKMQALVQQDGQSARVYFAAKRLLLEEYNSSLSEGEKIAFLREGLLKDLKRAILGTYQPTTVQDFQDHVLHVERDLAELTGSTSAPPKSMAALSAGGQPSSMEEAMIRHLREAGYEVGPKQGRQSRRDGWSSQPRHAGGPAASSRERSGSQQQRRVSWSREQGRSHSPGSTVQNRPATPHRGRGSQDRSRNRSQDQSWDRSRDRRENNTTDSSKPKNG